MIRRGLFDRFLANGKFAGNSKYAGCRAFSGQVFRIFRWFFRCPLKNRKKGQVSLRTENSPETANTRLPEHFPVRFLGFSVRFSVVCSHVLDFPVFFQERKIRRKQQIRGLQSIFRSGFSLRRSKRKKTYARFRATFPHINIRKRVFLRLGPCRAA